MTNMRLKRVSNVEKDDDLVIGEHRRIFPLFVSSPNKGTMTIFGYALRLQSNSNPAIIQVIQVLLHRQTKCQVVMSG